MYPYLETVIYNNFYEMLKGVWEKNPDNIAIRYRKNDKIEDISYTRLIEETFSIYTYLKKMGISEKNIGIVSENRYEYVPVYLGTAFNNIIVPVDKETTPNNLKKQIEDFDIEIIFYTEKTKSLVELIKEKICINIDTCYNEIIKEKLKVTDFFEEVKNTDSDRFSVLALTSGTTGELKGAMLSQRNITASLRGALQNNVLESPSLAVLPMNHTYGFNPGMLCTIYNGGTLCLTVNMKHFQRDLKEYDPYFVSIVPMIAEGIYNRIWAEARKQKKEKLLKIMIALSNFLLKFGIDVRKKFFGNLINKRLKFISCGGAPLNPCYVKKYMELGIYLLNGYGLTECAPLVSVNREFDVDCDSVGTVIKEMDVKIAKDNEILVKGANVMLGYYKSSEKVKDADGYFKTGDFGYMKERKLYITGRKKNLIILENGKNVSPEVIELQLNSLSWVKECLITTRKINGRDMITALIYSENKPSSEVIDKDIEQVNKNFPEYMQIMNYEFLSEEFEKNSVKKILRNKYEEKK